MPLVGHPHRRKLSGPQQLGQVHPIAPVRLYPVACFLRDERRSCHHAVVAEAPDQSVEPVSRRSCLVTERQTTVFSGKLRNQLAGRRLGGIELPEITHLSAAAAFSNRYCITQFRGVNSDESFAMMPHACPPCMRLCPAHPGNPRRYIEGESPIWARDIQSSPTCAVGGGARDHLPSSALLSGRENA